MVQLPVLRRRPLAQGSGLAVPHQLLLPALNLQAVLQLLRQLPPLTPLLHRRTAATWFTGLPTPILLAAIAVTRLQPALSSCHLAAQPQSLAEQQRWIRFFQLLQVALAHLLLLPHTSGKYQAMVQLAGPRLLEPATQPRHTPSLQPMLAVT